MLSIIDRTIFALDRANHTLSRPLAARKFPDQRTSGSAPCSCGVEKWIERAFDAEEEGKDDELVAKHGAGRRPSSSSLDSAVVLPLVDATSEFLAVAVRCEMLLLSEPAAIQRRLSSAEETARARLRID